MWNDDDLGECRENGEYKRGLLDTDLFGGFMTLDHNIVDEKKLFNLLPWQLKNWIFQKKRQES